MTTLSPTISVCRNCQHYSAEGRRGGQCQQLGAPVSGSWKACSLAIPPFSPSWETPDNINIWKTPYTSQPLGITSQSMLAALEVCIQTELSEQPTPAIQARDSTSNSSALITSSID